jgi:hypothetical protein
MGDYQVTCIIKRNRSNPHERIEYLGQQGDWVASEDTIIRWIEIKAHSFYTSVNGRAARVVVAEHNGRKYLKTTADGYSPDNLLSLPDCLNCKVTS